MTGRELILDRIRQNKPEQKPLPEYNTVNNNIESERALVIQFVESLKRVGASVREVVNREEAIEYIEHNFQNTINLMNPMQKESFKKKVSNDELEKTDTVIMEGQIGVAENGAVWVDETIFPHRLLPFVPRQLVLVLDRKRIVVDMHEAYQKIDFQKIGFGVFISGPSKTADIEQSLVYGAHGAKKVMINLI